ncbi:hypothetical protein Agub_g14388, partial [Astrephomene gubernaculifera]
QDILSALLHAAVESASAAAAAGGTAPLTPPLRTAAPKTSDMSTSLQQRQQQLTRQLVLDIVHSAAELQRRVSLTTTTAAAVASAEGRGLSSSNRQHSFAAAPARSTAASAPPVRLSARMLEGLAAAQGLVDQHWDEIPMQGLLQYGSDMETLCGSVPRVAALAECAMLLPALRDVRQGLEQLQQQLSPLQQQQQQAATKAPLSAASFNPDFNSASVGKSW